MLRVSYMEIYNETVIDLLAAPGEQKELKTRENAVSMGL